MQGSRWLAVAFLLAITAIAAVVAVVAVMS